MFIVVAALVLCLVAACVRNRQLRRRIAALQAESARALEDDGLMAQLETAAALGSKLATRLLPPMKNGPDDYSDHMRAAFEADFAASKEPNERFQVVERWHKKGLVLPLKRRVELLDGAMNRATRDTYRDWFDEQDAQQRKTPT